MSIEYPCVHWNDGKCKKFSDDKITSWCVESPCNDQAPSNADRIRAMSDEELAVFLADEICHGDCYGCELVCSTYEGDKFEDSCHNAYYRWLEQPAERREGE